MIIEICQCKKQVEYKSNLALVLLLMGRLRIGGGTSGRGRARARGEGGEELVLGRLTLHRGEMATLSCP